MSFQAHNGSDRGQARREQNKVMIVSFPEFLPLFNSSTNHLFARMYAVPFTAPSHS